MSRRKQAKPQHLRSDEEPGSVLLPGHGELMMRRRMRMMMMVVVFTEPAGLECQRRALV